MTGLSPTPWKNRAGNQTSRPRRADTPRSPEEVSALVRRAAAEGLRVKAVGAGHSCSAVAVTDGVLLRPDGLTAISAADPAAGTVTVGAGVRLDRLGDLLADHGLALGVPADLAGQTVAGATATGAHGTGRATASLSGLVRAMEVVLADGEIVLCAPHENAELFAGARVGLGALGIVTAVTLAVEPAFLLDVREEPAPFDEVLEHFDELRSDHDHAEFSWIPHTDCCTVRRANRGAGPARPPSRARFPRDDQLVANAVFALACRLGKAAPRAVPRLARITGRARRERTYTEVPHKVFAGPRRVRFVEMEYALPLGALAAALRDLRELVGLGEEYVSFPVTVRAAPADDMWLSTAYGRDTAYVAVRMVRGTPHERFFAAVEEIMTAYQGRPHWGRLHTRDAAYLADAYPRFASFTALRDRVDPERRFGNDYLRRVLGE
ncbi:FAD-binding protein [Yinghuangia sp. ASG 101]|uniref:D-arabinono-1,4-lactone oxidase n=1 Tax=Yinghuangia sp. ASG 101 TaxID=2896848 RepID=UPI001E38AE71|nr:D-arabinono-1,4-lactone oxidase [Yinghuangia sp. ASG 101]UGQ13865.1 FAD-binding protein [Yinghuangia sp. ASG 101]